jgi:hypothetical protein
MSQLRFKIDFTISPNEIKKEWPSFFLMGSCFSENQGHKLQYFGFDTFFNPFGIIFNPISISKLFSRIASGEKYQEDDFIFHNELFFSLEHHGLKQYENLSDAINKSNDILANAIVSLKKADVVIITLGTSIVYHHLEQGDVVANCHKIPSKNFDKKQLTYEQTQNAIESIVKNIRRVNLNTKIIFTISPVRHLKSGVVENSLSKAVLRAALEPFIDNELVSYFPAYEIFIDELRDYRFCKNDLMHPTDDAITYIWQRFTKTYFSNATLNIMEDIEKFKLFENHSPLRNKEIHTQKVEEKREILEKNFPFIKIKK